MHDYFPENIFECNGKAKGMNPFGFLCPIGYDEKWECKGNESLWISLSDWV